MDYSSLFDYSVDPSSLVAAAAGGALGWNAVTIQEGMRKSLVHFDDISKFLAANRAVSLLLLLLLFYFFHLLIMGRNLNLSLNIL